MQIDKMSKNRFLVFVYGTLKKGEPNHHWLSDTQNGFQQFLGQAETVNMFPLVIASRLDLYNFSSEIFLFPGTTSPT